MQLSREFPDDFKVVYMLAHLLLIISFYKINRRRDFAHSLSVLILSKGFSERVREASFLQLLCIKRLPFPPPVSLSPTRRKYCICPILRACLQDGLVIKHRDRGI